MGSNCISSWSVLIFLLSVISGRWKGEHERLCAMKCCLCSGRISPQAGFEPATRWSEVRTARKPKLRPTTLPFFSNLTRGSYGNRQNVPRIKTEQYSKYIFNTNPLAFFMELYKKKTSLTRFDPGTSRLLDMYFTTALFCTLKYSDEIKIYNESILIQGKTTHFLNKNSGVLKL